MSGHTETSNVARVHVAQSGTFREHYRLSHGSSSVAECRGWPGRKISAFRAPVRLDARSRHQRARHRDLGLHGAGGESETAVGSVDEMQVPRVLQAKQQTGYQRRSRRVYAIDDVAPPVRGGEDLLDGASLDRRAVEHQPQHVIEPAIVELARTSRR